MTKSIELFLIFRYNLEKGDGRMYKINEVTRQIDSGKEIKFYGIESECVCYKELSSKAERVKELCDLFNSLDIDKRHIDCIIDDFLNS